MNDENGNWQTIYPQPSTDDAGAMLGQNNYLQTNTGYPMGTSTLDADEIARKIKFWSRLSLILGFVSFFGYMIVFIAMDSEAYRYGQHYWPAVIFFSVIVSGPFFMMFLVLSTVALIRVIKLSVQREKHIFKDYAFTIAGMLMFISAPFIVSVLMYPVLF